MRTSLLPIPVLRILCAVAPLLLSGCMLPSLPSPLSTPYMASLAEPMQERGRAGEVFASAGALLYRDQQNFNLDTAVPGAGVELRLAERYRIQGSVGFGKLGLTGALRMAEGERLGLDLIHGIGAGWMGHLGVERSGSAVLADATLGILASMGVGSRGALFVGPRYAYATYFPFGTSPLLSFESRNHYALMSLGYADRVGGLHVRPELLFGAVWFGPGLFDWFVAPSLTLAAPF